MTVTARALAVTVALVVAVIVPLYASPYRNLQLTLVAVYAIAVLGLQLLTGFGGQVSLGHSAFFAAGAYTTAALVDGPGWPALLTLPIAAAASFVLGLALGYPAMRTRGVHLALVTLALAVVTPPLARHRSWEGVTGGAGGLALPSPRAPGWTSLDGDQWAYYVCLAVAVVAAVVARNVLTSRVGRAVVALRDDHLVAASSGVDVHRAKVLAFAWSAAYAGVAGSLYAYVVAFVSPESFTVTLAVSFLAAVVVGGVASLPGVVVGAFFIEFVPVWAADVDVQLSGVVYGVALVACMLVLPGGAAGLARSGRERLAPVLGRKLERGVA